MDHFPNYWGMPPQESFDRYNIFQDKTKNNAISDPTTNTKQPIVTGTSVIAFKYKDASFGSLARYREVERLYPVGEYTVLASSGDFSDFQYVKHTLDKIMTKEYYTNDGHILGTPHIYEYLSQVMYHRRSKLNPLWNAFVVGGYHNGEGYLGYVNLLGTTFQASTITTGIGMYMASPLLRKAVEGHEDTLTEAEAVDLVEQVMRVLYYRDSQSINRYQRAKITAQGVEISPLLSAPTDWSIGKDLRGYQ
ncbi:13331_t:CDS:2 [Ambispora gerdemannii]|uniref:Proteasome subunit beta n=1 Tax=Ambispora gerdemannii TaxID=144530 RepID=A0A9N9DFY7_9GLOM|nr:13331_t:CDS:2 [Ambispora gerdemannii]